MKPTVAALLAALTTTCFGQNIRIDAPANDTSVSAGSEIVVQVVRPITLTPSIELGIVIGLLSCNLNTTHSVCPSPSEAMGNILFKGNFSPKFQFSLSTGPQQNFTVTIPSTFEKGPAELSIFHTALLGAENMPLGETVAIVLNVD